METPLSTFVVWFAAEGKREKKIVVNGVALNSAVSSLQYWKVSTEGARMQGKGRG